MSAKITVRGTVRERTNERGSYGVFTSAAIKAFINKPVIAIFELDEEQIANIKAKEEIEARV